MGDGNIAFKAKKSDSLIGPYPEIGLQLARETRDKARALLASGTDPSAQKKAQKEAVSTNIDSSFEAIARDWHSGRSRIWSVIHSKNVSRPDSSRNVFPFYWANIYFGRYRPRATQTTAPH